MNNNTNIRMATLADAKQLLAIYTPYVEQTAITFEDDVPTLAEFSKRMESVLARYPYLVIENDGEIVGYAYASQFKERSAYDWSVETSIYVKQGCAKHGYGRRLHEVLEASLKLQGIKTMCACIGVPREANDPYLTMNSVDFHSHLGYRLVGRFNCSGYKFDRWYDMVWMEYAIGTYDIPAIKVTPFSGALLAEALALK